MKLLKLGTSVAIVLMAAPAVAQDTTVDEGTMTRMTDAQMQQAADDLNAFDYESVYQSNISVDRLLANIEVHGANGNEIGGIENLVFSDDGEVQSIIAEVGGFWDIGDTHVNVPWDEVEIAPNLNHVTVPITEASVDEYVTFPDVISRGGTEYLRAVDDDLDTGTQVFKATDLIGDYARLSDQTPYGYVGDLLINQEGEIKAIVVDAATYGQRGFYAYPYNPGYGVNARSQNLYLPYGATQVTEIDEFDYDRLTTGRS